MCSLETLLHLIQNLCPKLPELLDSATAEAFDRTFNALAEQALLDPETTRLRILQQLRLHPVIREWTEQFLSELEKKVPEPTRSATVDTSESDSVVFPGVAGVEVSNLSTNTIDVDFAFSHEVSFDMSAAPSSFLPSLEFLEPPQSPGSEELPPLVPPPQPLGLPGVLLETLDFSEDESSCYVKAEMANSVMIHQVITVTVIVSKEVIEIFNSSVAQSQKILTDSGHPLIIQAIPKVNFETIGSDRIEINPAILKEPRYLYFDLKSTHLGLGEIWIIIRQSQMPLATLKLTPKIVAATPQQIQSLSIQSSIPSLTSHSESPHELRILERQNGIQTIYEYEFRSPSLNILERYESRPINGDRQQYIEKIYQEIESRWSNIQEDITAFAEELRALGGQLLDELVPESLQSQLWQHRQALQSIMVISSEPFIPWEIIHLKPPGQSYLPDEVCFLGQLGLVRWLYDTGFPPTNLALRSNRCRYLIPHYGNNSYRLPQAEQEVPFLKQTFQATAIAPTPLAVIQALQSSDFDLLHFAGHGQAEPGAPAKLLLEGKHNTTTYIPSDISATTVSQYCRFRASKTQPIILLNACQIGRNGYALTGVSGFAPAFLKAGAGTFVGSLWSVGDRPARVFSESLYSSLLAGLTLAEATCIAREKSKVAGDATWLAYVVYGHPHLRVTLRT
jgi:CHAT domain